MISKTWRVTPSLDAPPEGIWVGPGKGDCGIWLGALAEVAAGKKPRVWLATAKEQVVAVVGKRGSGKSFTLGVIAEGLAAQTSSPLVRGDQSRGVLLFDPLDVYWTTRYPVAPSVNTEAQRHFEMATALSLTGSEFDVGAWIPGEQNRRGADPDWFKTLVLPASELGPDEWELLLGTNSISEPIGQAFVDVLELVRTTGYSLSGEFVTPAPSFDLSDLAAATAATELSNAYHRETIRALKQRLASLGSTGLFGRDGTRVGDLVAPGRVTVIMLGRVSQSVRTVVVAILTRMLIQRRTDTAFAEKRLALDPGLLPAESEDLMALVANGVPRAVVMLDEAQSFLSPGESNPAKGLFVKLVKEGRNLGLSTVIATQQPSAIDSRVLSQVETFVAHQLVTEADIRSVRENLKSALPQKFQMAGHDTDVGGVLRELTPGTCLLSAADMTTAVKRSFLASIRPRATVHGGIEL